MDPTADANALKERLAEEGAADNLSGKHLSDVQPSRTTKSRSKAGTGYAVTEWQTLDLFLSLGLLDRLLAPLIIIFM